MIFLCFGYFTPNFLYSVNYSLFKFKKFVWQAYKLFTYSTNTHFISISNIIDYHPPPKKKTAEKLLELQEDMTRAHFNRDIRNSFKMIG